MSFVLDLFTLEEEAGDNSKRTGGEALLCRSATVVAPFSLSMLIDSKVATSVCTREVIPPKASIHLSHSFVSMINDCPSLFLALTTYHQTIDCTS